MPDRQPRVPMKDAPSPTVVAASASRAMVVLAFAAVYVIWGTTYLAIRLAIETVPPFLMAGTRFVIAGGLVYSVLRLTGVRAPSRLHWKSGLIIGGLLIFGGNGGVVWAEQLVPSGIAALLIGMVPLWMVLLDWLRPRGIRPGRGVAVGLALGLTGVVLLVGPSEFASATGRINPLGAAVLIVGALSWALGSLYARTATIPDSALMATALEMLAGGALLWGAGLATSEVAGIRLDHLSVTSAGAMGYLILFGSLIGFTAYTWLLRVSTPARVSTYAFVNPVIAVFVGWGLAGEPLDALTLLSAAVIVASVALITLNQERVGAGED